MNTTFDIATRPASITSQGASTAYVQQAGYWPSGAGYYWQYGNTLWPVEGYSAQLTPWYTDAALNNSGSSYLVALGIIRNADGTVQQTSEAFGPAGSYSGLTFLYQNYNYDPLKRLLAVRLAREIRLAKLGGDTANECRGGGFRAALAGGEPEEATDGRE